MGPFPLSSAQSHIPLGEYIFKRIESLDVKSVFGVPGDFNLSLLEHLYSTKLKWYGGCNELNAGYSADGYARASHKFGVLVTTRHNIDRTEKQRRVDAPCGTRQTDFKQI
ncbi:hypothetical protein KL905_004984 [Ogataea polymorpha]|nr:hypothetical protein KL937_004998 [Ogataea polymorpha]KAG7888680.1 hypothetical protein KL908_005040 [Ogataea polymorpha]KAG7897587.1 hypothetical protein KL935_005017 [Ogataea polymorpha]KAG7915348.1 hypothetical protein KL905_004984 [Ogataea polymorpha]KAG7930065.1 hypothetical protein KL934_005177 [Ogataea polymorpha]